MGGAYFFNGIAQIVKAGAGYVSVKSKMMYSTTYPEVNNRVAYGWADAAESGLSGMKMHAEHNP